jgi:hypothetical protein
MKELNTLADLLRKHDKLLGSVKKLNKEFEDKHTRSLAVKPPPHKRVHLSSTLSGCIKL